MNKDTRYINNELISIANKLIEVGEFDKAYVHLRKNSGTDNSLVKSFCMHFKDNLQGYYIEKDPYDNSYTSHRTDNQNSSSGGGAPQDGGCCCGGDNCADITCECCTDDDCCDDRNCCDGCGD